MIKKKAVFISCVSTMLWRHGGSTEVKVPYSFYHGSRWRSLVNILPKRNTPPPLAAGNELSIRIDLDIVKVGI
jgi:hypothetical protein